MISTSERRNKKFAEVEKFFNITSGVNLLGNQTNKRSDKQEKKTGAMLISRHLNSRLFKMKLHDDRTGVRKSAERLIKPATRICKKLTIF